MSHIIRPFLAATLGVTALAAVTTTPAPVLGQLNFDHYHRWEEAHDIMSSLAQRYPSLTELYSIGLSFEGVNLMVIEVTNERTGPASEKPAFYLDGGIHAAELTGSEVALYTLAYLLENYGKDEQVTRLLDTRAFYIRPKFNPDGSNLVLDTDESLRSSVHPVDEDGDGSADEDPAQDLDGDGWITRMRIPDPEGRFVVSPADSRIMVEREPESSGPFYRLVSEGVDDDGDGRLNEDGTGGLDLNRNFPRNWERAHLQPGAGDFPLSEPETYATARFVNEHRNINFIMHGHTSGGFVYRLPSASNPELFDTTDLRLITHLGEFYSESTGREVIPSSTHPTNHRYGTLISFGYWDHGVIGWVPEYSPPPDQWVPDADGNGEIDESDWHAYNDAEFGGRYFSPWVPYEHPSFGPVEIGGWHRKFWGQNPPDELLLDELKQQVPWFLYLTGLTPRLELDTPNVTPLGDGLIRVTATVRNSGYLPTHLTQRGHVGGRTREGDLTDQVISPPTLTLSVEGGEIVEGGDDPEPGGRKTIAHLAGSNPFLTQVTARSATVTWVVRPTRSAGSIRVTARSSKGGVARSSVVSWPR